MRPMPIRIRGVDYPSAKAAAEALGITTRTIYTHLNNGTLDNAGIGSGRGPKPRKRKGHRHGRVPLSTHILPHQRDLMKKISAERGISMSQIQEMAIAEWLSRNETLIIDDEVAAPVRVYDAVEVVSLGGDYGHPPTPCMSAGQRIIAGVRQAIEAVRRGDIP